MSAPTEADHERALAAVMVIKNELPAGLSQDERREALAAVFMNALKEKPER